MDDTFDKIYQDRGELIGGIDESGVSDIAGPLVAACVILPKIDRHRDDLKIFEVNDSKQIPEKYRKQHAEIVWQIALGIGIGEVQPFEVDYLGKHASIKLAMMRAVAACKKPYNKKPIQPDFLLIDGELTLPSSIPHQTVRDADAKSLCVASASIVAKVYRDELMIKLHDQHPQYDWMNNKGYPCENQFRGIDTHGLQLGIHRIRFWPFVENTRYAENRAEWRERRNLWKRVTEGRMAATLENRPWTTEPKSSNASTSSKNSLDQAQPSL